MGAGKSKSELNLPSEDNADTQTATSNNEVGERRSCISSKHLLWGMFIFTALWCIALCITAFSTMDNVQGCEDYTGSHDYLKDQLQSIEAAIIFMFITVFLWGVWSSLVLMQKFVVWGCGGSSNPFLSCVPKSPG
ncbi:hypothetical protein CYMTET_9598 [Cymbomonas tetramitiformis]|uniref:Uncharacterized protein n=1 Tax=Cymbomonas tetramitiformis TaxID=36881 RepID=A0AAE0LEZ3_9CHLO|nr:hypothetical protein CYMTET_9598 [Cymbomonas tetramitiformis]